MLPYIIYFFQEISGRNYFSSAKNHINLWHLRDNLSHGTKCKSIEIPIVYLLISFLSEFRSDEIRLMTEVKKLQKPWTNHDCEWYSRYNNRNWFHVTNVLPLFSMFKNTITINIPFAIATEKNLHNRNKIAKKKNKV